MNSGQAETTHILKHKILTAIRKDFADYDKSKSGGYSMEDIVIFIKNFRLSNCHSRETVCPRMSQTCHSRAGGNPEVFIYQ